MRTISSVLSHSVCVAYLDFGTKRPLKPFHDHTQLAEEKDTVTGEGVRSHYLINIIILHSCTDIYLTTPTNLSKW